MSYAAAKLTGRSYRLSDEKCSELSLPYQVLTPRLEKAPGLSELTGFPALGSAPSSSDIASLPGSEDLVMTDVDVTEHESGIRWEFRAVYKLPKPGPAAGGTTDSYQTRITHGTNILTIESPVDVTGVEFKNSAGRPYDKPVPIQVPARVITVEKNLKEKISISGVSGTCNLDEITIDGETFKAMTAILNATIETTGNRAWPYRLRFTITELMQLDKNGKNSGAFVDVVNRGYECFAPGSTDDLILAKVPGEDGKDIPSPTPVLLSENGHEKEPTAFLTYKTYTTARGSTWPEWVTE